MAKLKESPNIVTPPKNEQQNLRDDENEIGTVQFHGPYQPNYGTQINIDHLNVIVDPSKVLLLIIQSDFYIST